MTMNGGSALCEEPHITNQPNMPTTSAKYTASIAPTPIAMHFNTWRAMSGIFSGRDARRKTNQRFAALGLRGGSVAFFVLLAGAAGALVVAADFFAGVTGAGAVGVGGG